MKTIIVDGKNSFFRHNHMSNLTNPIGQKVSGAIGVFKEAKVLCEIHRPDRLIVAWDSGRSKLRKEIYPEYKANRKLDEEELANIDYQIKLVKSMLNTLPVIQIAVAGTEADDIIGFLCEKLMGRKIIYSNDTDFYQLLSEDVDILKPKTKKIFTFKDAEKELGFKTNKYVIWKSIVGDSSDNIKGIKGIGPKIATKIIRGEVKKELDKEIIKRNMKLISIGYPLTIEDKKNIITQYKSHKDKTINEKEIKKILIEQRCDSLYMNLEHTLEPFRQLEN